MEKCRIIKAQESKDVKVEDEVNVHHIFLYQWHHAHRIFATGDNCKPTCVQGNFAKAGSLMWTKRRDWYEKNDWLLRHNNALSHNALSIHQFLTKRNIIMLDQPPYSPDLAPCVFFCSVLQQFFFKYS